MPMSRRAFVSSAATSLALSGLARRAEARQETYRNEVPGYGPLVKDPNGVFDLPQGFSYDIVSQAGETMSDGFLVPYKADGMGCFQFEPDRVTLVRNHELKPTDVNNGPFGLKKRLARALDAALAYDSSPDGIGLPGGTTNLVWDLRARRLMRQNLSLVGTIRNCAGGTTPWGSWLTCEETSDRAGGGLKQDHGWVFEVPASATGPVAPTPLRALGRFNHEAACVDPRTGVVYLTEDEDDGLFYRFLPERPGNLAAGGRLQALGFRDAAGADTRNWGGRTFWRRGEWKDAVWIDLEGVDNPHGDLKERGRRQGAAVFARGEGVHMGEGELYFTCTSGGPAKIGQIVRYALSPEEGRPGETAAPGRAQLFVQSVEQAVMDYADNLTIAPWGHLIVCEDRYRDDVANHLKGVTPQGKVYTLGRNAYEGSSELAGACFAPDGSTLFVNIYWPGITLAITGPWASVRT